MKFSSSIWRILGRHVGADAYLFVDAELGLIIVNFRHSARWRSRMSGFGLWYYELGDYEIVTTHVKRSGENHWLKEYFRIYSDWMQWSNFQNDIFHERVEASEVPEDFLGTYRSMRDLFTARTKPDYDPNKLR
ncbi:MAG: hypothetical protein ACSHX6_16465 [Akkermansiaceae bacterium]